MSAEKLPKFDGERIRTRYMRLNSVRSAVAISGESMLESRCRSDAAAGRMLMGRRLRVDYAVAKTSGRRNGPASPTHEVREQMKPRVRSAGGDSSQRDASQDKPPGCTTVFCGNLAFDIDEPALREVMEP
eukprot:643157-Hanusia_phi.AAC.6